MVSDVADVVQGLDVPVAADQRGELGVGDRAGWQTGAGVDGDDGGLTGAAAFDLDGLGGMGKGQAGPDGADLHAADLAAAVPILVGVVIQGGFAPGQGLEPAQEGGPVALIDTRGVGRELSAEAFERTTGVPMRRQATIDGLTEPVIFRETAALHGLHTTRADFERFATALAQAHQTRSADLRTRGQALPGAARALAALAALPSITQIVVTGNIRPVAHIKLSLFELDRHISWEIGAFGEDSDVRTKLVRIALRRASDTFGEPITPGDTVLIGDTLADMNAALENGVPVIAVASGRSSMDDLREAGAERVLPDLTDTDLLLDWVRHPSRD